MPLSLMNTPTARSVTSFSVNGVRSPSWKAMRRTPGKLLERLGAGTDEHDGPVRAVLLGGETPRAQLAAERHVVDHEIDPALRQLRHHRRRVRLGEPEPTGVEPDLRRSERVTGEVVGHL